MSEPKYGNTMKLGDLFPLAVAEFRNVGCDRTRGLPAQSIRAMYTGEYRAPKAGEWFLSGAIVEAYYTRNDLDTAYRIARLVRVQTRTVTTVEEML